ncbi:MAG TPA: HAMP domain-containing sensor histidine kinase [Candidatus Binatia bacterium]|jgi:PAS domain S-box-containing protein
MRSSDSQRPAAPNPTPPRPRRADLPLLVGAALLLTTLLHDQTALLPGIALLASLLAFVVASWLQRQAAAATARPAPNDDRVRELERRLARLAASEERHRSLVEQSGAPILTFDLSESLTSINRAAELLFGWDRDLVIGTPASQLLSEPSIRALRRWTRRDMLTPAEPTALALQGVHREGRVLHLEAQPSVVQTCGVPVGFAIVCRDTTKQGELDQLRSDFLAMVGHDIRNPLSAIFGYTEMMLDPGSTLSPAQRELLLRINNNTRTVLTLVGNFLDSSRIESGRMTLDRRPIDVNAVARRTVEQYAAHAQLVDLRVDLALDPDLPPILADELQVERVAANLLTNAIKFTPRGGIVTLRTERLPSSVGLAISDTGVGIPSHEFSRIFQRYARHDDGTHEGTGLGLYIVGTLVEAHGGFVTIDSMPGAGTTFTAYLPIVDWRAPSVDAAVSAGPGSSALQ